MFGDFEVGDANNAMAEKKSPYPMSNDSKFNFDLSLSLLQEENYIRVILHHPNSFYEFEHHLNEAFWFLHSANPSSKSKINICSTMLFWHEIKHI